MDVPDSATYESLVDPIAADRMGLPGAATSGFKTAASKFGPRELNDEIPPSGTSDR